MIRPARVVSFVLPVALAVASLGLTPSVADAGLITYSGTLNPGVALAGTNSQALYNYNNPVGATYFRFHATAGNVVRVEGHRATHHYDMAFWIFQGLFTDTAEFGGTFNTLHAAYVSRGDDEIQHPGPYGDPLSLFGVTTTGWYTVAVTNYASTNSPPYEFTVEAVNVDAVPEPGTLLLLGAGLGLLRLRRRRN